MSPAPVQVLDRAIELLELLATSENGMTLAELSSKTDLPKSTIHRILATYTKHHYIEKCGDNSTYYLGYKFVQLASLYLNQIVLTTEAASVMQRVATRFNATSYLGVFENNEVVYLGQAEQINSLRLYTQIGKREPVHCTALGKVLMSAFPEPVFRQIAQNLSYRKYTENTISSYEAYTQEVAQVREKGYAVDYAEHTPNSCCLAVPVYDYTQKVIAAMSVSGSNLLRDYDEALVYQTLSEAAFDLSKRMGYTAKQG